jgi:quercetin dioxygenase-like cupin family protein
MEDAMRNIFAVGLALAAGLSAAQAQDAAAPVIKRTPLASHQIAPAKSVTHAEIVRLDFLPGMVTPPHLHPVPVITYIEKGEFLVQAEGQPARHYHQGESVYEPANTRMLHYDNVSKTESATAIATYLAGADDHTLITLLPSR